MSRRVGNVVIIEAEPPDLCAFCKKYKELRPYGPNKQRICYQCAMKDRATAEKMMGEVLFGVPPKGGTK